MSRAEKKDFVDLYFILQRYSLKEILETAKNKFKNTNDSLFLKAITFFDDLEDQPLKFCLNQEIKFSQVKKYLIKSVKNYLI